MSRPTAELLLSLDYLPKPVVTLLFYDDSIHYLAVVEKRILLICLADEDESDYQSWFVGDIPQAEVVKLMTGQGTLRHFIFKYCLHRLDYRAGCFSARAVGADDFANDFLPDEDFDVGFTYSDSTFANEILLDELGEGDLGDVFYLRFDSNDLPTDALGKVLQGIVGISLSHHRQLKEADTLENKKMYEPVKDLSPRLSIAPAASLGLRVVIPTGEEHQNSVGSFSDTIRALFDAVNNNEPTKESVISAFDQKSRSMLKTFFDGLADLKVDSEFSAINGRQSMHPSRLASVKISHDNSEKWREVIHSIKPEDEGLTKPSEEISVVGHFNTISSDTKGRYVFVPAKDDPTNKRLENFKKQKIDGLVGDQELADIFKRKTAGFAATGKFYVEHRKSGKKYTLTEIVE